jgi:hypothetical protein
MAELGMDDPPVNRDHLHPGLSSRRSSASHTPKASRALSPQRPEQNRPSSPSNNGSGNGNGANNNNNSNNNNNNNGFGPRRRLASVANRMGDVANAFSSPLAQLYQPLVVEEEAPETSSSYQTGNGQRAPGMSGPLGVSYGPASRRRLSSVAGPRPLGAAFGPNSGSFKDSLLSQGNLRKFPSGSHPPSEQSFAASPEQEDELPKRSSSIMDETSHESGAEMAKRLRKIEESQKRIEQLLMQVAAR